MGPYSYLFRGEAFCRSVFLVQKHSKSVCSGIQRLAVISVSSASGAANAERMASEHRWRKRICFCVTREELYGKR